MNGRRSTDHDGAGARISAYLGSIKARVVESEAPGERPVRSAPAEVLASIGSALVRDLDGLASAAVRMEESVAWCEALLDAIPDGLAETDLRGTIRFTNARLAAMLAVAPAFLAERPLIHFVARSDCRIFRGWVDVAARGEPPERAILHLRPRHGGA